ncbi:hypothetical protein [Bauldia sp.]|uniref:hypothetical protein n=1 Tax=Bauldia sp. TaxID=2575872 RepID=UPI003BACA3C0
MQYRTIQFQPNSWQSRIAVVLGSALAIGVAVAFVLLSLTLAVILLPLVAILIAVGWWRWRKIQAAMREQAAAQQKRRGDGPTIEIDYRVAGDPDPNRRE